MPKLTVKNYPEMLRKLSTAAFVVCVACLTYLRSSVVSIDKMLNYLDAVIPANAPFFSSMKIPLGTALIAFVIAVFTEAVKLHDKISDALEIRKTFDVWWILKPMAKLSGAKLTKARASKLEPERKRLMGEVFYKYASSTKPKIDRHTITQALTAWSWYWLCLEAIVIIILTAVIALLAKQFIGAAVLVAVAITLSLLMCWFWSDCKKYADSQVRQILNDKTRKTAIVAIFNAL
jgi:hypothetical protein